MAYREYIAKEIEQLIKNAPKGTTEYHLEHFDQQDVADTVNHFHYKNPRLIQETEV
nr:hypothetical protein JUJ52_18960 [Virgibacillus sp. AGTR]